MGEKVYENTYNVVQTLKTVVQNTLSNTPKFLKFCDVKSK